MKVKVISRLLRHLPQPATGWCGKVRFHLFSLIVILPGLFGSTGDALGQDRSTPLPFSIQKNGGISIQDILKLTQRPASRDRITDEELEKIKESNPTRYDREFTKTEGVMMPPRANIYDNSQILGVNGTHTVVPTHAVLYVPERLKNHLLDGPVGDLVLWPTFLTKNGSWIYPQEVSLEIAKGEQELSETILNSLARTDRIVIAVYKGFPISVVPQLSAPDSGADETTKQTSTRP